MIWHKGIFRIIIIISFTAFCCYSSHAQIKNYSFFIYDQDSGLPVQDAFVFVDQSEDGSTSDNRGYVSLSYNQDIISEIVISHVAYIPLIIPPSTYRHSIQASDTIFVKRNDFDLETIVVSEKKTNKWKKRFKRFRNDFLGTDPIGKNCKILNPEVLLFEERNGDLIATATDLIHINHPHLGYEINFVLINFKISKDHWVTYDGYANFLDKSENASDYSDIRNDIFKQSPRYFFKSLINKKEKENGFIVHHVEYNDGKFSKINQSIDPIHIKMDSLTGQYQCTFENFIDIELSHIKEEEVNTTMGVSPLEQQRFNTTDSGPITRYKSVHAQLSKISPSIILNKDGHVLNPQDIKEYGYWGLQRVAHLLPADFVEEEASNEEELLISSTPSFGEIINQVLYGSDEDKYSALTFIENKWDPAYLAPLLDLSRILHSYEIGDYINDIINRITNNKAKSYSEGLIYAWQQDSTYNKYYPEFKAVVYNHIDPKFSNYFNNRYHQSTIRFDEIVWGGVKQDGIPPLRYPEHILGQSADYLSPRDIVFGIIVNGEARAYPKRILGWHEMVVDSIQSTDITGVYCTLCGTMIAYKSKYKNRLFNLGTSGFLYQSNKLMYDSRTQSLWSTIDGEPVVGPLVNQGIKLDVLPMVTTTWEEWLSLHPETKVLTLNTGYDRDYSEGAAYKEYYAHDDLMFPVKERNNKLRNKSEVFIVRIDENRTNPTAFSVDKLISEEYLQHKLKDKNIILIATKNGNIRAYDRGNYNFNSFHEQKLTGAKSGNWNITDDFLINDKGIKLKRLPGHRIFWFAWYAAHPNTILIK